jgi:hypothetical protein
MPWTFLLVTNIAAIWHSLDGKQNMHAQLHMTAGQDMHSSSSGAA